MTKTLNKIEINNIISQIFEIYGTSALLAMGAFILFLFVLWVGYLILKHKGFLTTPLERSLASINKTMDGLKDGLNDLTKVTKPHLTDSQLQTIANTKITAYQHLIHDAVMDIFRKNHINEKQNTLNRIETRINSIIIDEDESFFKVPNISSKILSKDHKILLLKSENIYLKIYDIMIANRESFDDVYRLTRSTIETFIVSFWRVT
jgi:hypothetical protein